MTDTADRTAEAVAGKAGAPIAEPRLSSKFDPRGKQHDE